MEMKNAEKGDKMKNPTKNSMIIIITKKVIFMSLKTFHTFYFVSHF